MSTTPTISTNACSANGFLFRDCQRMANQDRNIFAACMVALGDADALVTGLTRNFSVALDNVRRAIDQRPGHRPIGVSMAMVRGRTVFIADTSIHELPSAEELADIAQEAAGVARRFGYEPRVALLSYSTFGYPRGERAQYVRDAVGVLDRRNVDFEYDGEMGADVALSREAMALYPFCRLTGASQCAGDAGRTFGLDLDQDAAAAGRRHRGRALAHGPRQARADGLHVGHRLGHREPCGHRRLRHQPLGAPKCAK